MRLNVYTLSAKIVAHRPHVVCFVGKKIWDIYESVVLKTAGPPVAVVRDEAPGSAPFLVKLEEDDDELVRVERVETGAEDRRDATATGVQMFRLAESGGVKIEPAASPVSPPRTKHPATSSTPQARSKKTHIDWTKPRGVRLAHERGYTYFWVTPNTSGLERTPVSKRSWPSGAQPLICTDISSRSRFGSTPTSETFLVPSNPAEHLQDCTKTSTCTACNRPLRPSEPQPSPRAPRSLHLVAYTL